MIAGIHISQEIFADDISTALKPSSEHDHKYILCLLRLLRPGFILTIFSERESLWTHYGFRYVYSGYNVDYDVSYEFMINDYGGYAHICPERSK